MPNHANQPKAVQSGEIPKDLVPGLSNLGCGYNIFGQYASAASIKVQLFDWHKKDSYEKVDYKEYSKPDIVDVIAQPDSSDYYKSGTSLHKYQQSLSGSCDLDLGFELFSGSLKSDFSSEHLRQSQYSYCRVQKSVSYVQLAFKPTLNAARQWLFDHVADMLNNAQTPQQFDQIFEHLGSHYLNNINIGGRAVQSSSIHIDHVTSSDEYGANATMAFEASIGLGIKDEKKIEKFSQNSNIQCVALGGDTSLFPTGFFADGDKTAQQDFLNQYNSWVESIESNPVFIDFIDHNSLAPIWQLCDEPEQSERLKHYFYQTWAPKKQYQSSIKQPYLNDFAVVPFSQLPPPGFTELMNLYKDDQGNIEHVEITMGDDGHVPYLRMVAPNLTEVSNNADCITDIIRVERHSVPDNYTKLSGLLYEFYGKHYYLAVKTEPYQVDNAIRNVMILDHTVHAPIGYTKMSGSLNSPGDSELYLYYIKNS